jgi:type II secretory pathway pseudopilin PulG
LSRKKPFILIEVLIGLSLVSIVLFSVIGKSSSYLGEISKKCFFLESSRDADALFIQIRQKISSGDIAWEDLDSYESIESYPHPFIKKGSSYQLKVSFKTSEKLTKQGKFKKVDIKIKPLYSLSVDKGFTYSLVAKKVS